MGPPRILDRTRGERHKRNDQSQANLSAATGSGTGGPRRRGPHRSGAAAIHCCRDRNRKHSAQSGQRGSLMPTPAEKRATFRKLHAQGCFVIPNPWDVGSARYLQGLGFKALASTSAGFAFTQGLPDGAVSRAMMLAHFREIVAATDVPVNPDFKGGFADAPEGVAESVKLCIDTGVAGLSIEDSTSDPAIPLYDFELALARVRAARAAVDEAGGDVVFTARSEGFIRGRPDLDRSEEPSCRARGEN